MKSKLLCLAMVLSASLSFEEVTAKPVLEPVQQNRVTETKSLTLSSNNLVTEESNPENTQKDSPKPTKKKRHLAAKIITGIGVAFGLVVAIFVLSYTASQH